MKQFFILLLLFCSTSTQRTFAIPTRLQPVNAVIGDISYLKTFGTLPTAKTNEQVRLRTHLAYVERLLRSANTDHLSTSQKAKRAFLLDRLHEYWVAGQFPKNLDYTNERRPCFIDRYGNICAVGYLLAIDGGWEVAELINAKAKYSYLHSMNILELDEWVNQSGLSKLECAMIQPGYSTYVPNPALTITKVFPSVTSAINQPFQILLQASAFLRVDIFPWGFDPMYLGAIGSPRITIIPIPNTIVNPTTGTVTINPEYNMILNIDSLALRFFEPGKKYQIIIYSIRPVPDSDRFIVSYSPGAIGFEVSTNAITSIQEEKLLSDVSIYPNPTTNFVNVRSAEKISQVRVLSTLGQEVYLDAWEQQQQKHERNIDLTNLSQGVYFVEVSFGKNRKIEKVIRQ